MGNIYTKIATARDMLHLGQVEVENKSGLKQSDISLLENGKKRFVPTIYLEFLALKGIDLNTIFDPRHESPAMLKDRPPANGAECSLCVEKDARISDLKDHIKALSLMLEDLKLRYNCLKHETSSGNHSA